MKRNLNIGPFGYSLIGFLVIATLITFVRAVVMSFTHFTDPYWITMAILIWGGIIFGVSVLSYWVGRGVVYLISLLD